MSEHGHVDTVVIGAGHAGLAMSRLLTDAGRDHVVLDRGRIGERWRTERWDSLHLLTPNWMTRLPGWPYAGPDPDGFRSASELVGTLEKYAASFAAPVVEGAAVRSVRQAGLQQYDVATDCGSFRTRHVVVATGPHGTPNVPDALRGGDVEVRTSNQYRNPDQLAAGGVLVVGASSSGVQIANELSRAGRDVVLAVGRHTRMPRRYRGMDAFWWMEQTGRTARTIDEVRDAAAARAEPSLQLVGRTGAGTAADDLDLAVLQARGVRLAGRLESLTGGTATFSDDLPQVVAAADRQMHRFLDVVDDHIDRVGLTAEVWPPARPRRVDLTPTPRSLDLGAEGIRTVLLATGFRPDHSWLHLPVLEPGGAIRQYRGVTAAPGVYVVGQRFQHRRDSGFIDGARHDARAVTTHLLTGSHPPLARAERPGDRRGSAETGRAV
ncbi:NAD(P)-binding domain-containing protein [Nocardioides sp.]|uniref:NAD(P)-binding domain-containing protein n=1 Tax=Nocardioides sp. TaxID=35761 RepID=UPI002ED49AE8